ncbi:hypothetical protein TorRG33x02_210110 [Trema orientale]|uniref:Uncharacterized protein n=1 Tax=Trema orientale TaxID=63057 RepID=A0A2P5ECA4_TREOI|nr:hypothetical protein TorRG33x02_210110 [Trema orientale]
MGIMVFEQRKEYLKVKGDEYVPNELLGGMISLSQAPATATILFFLLQIYTRVSYPVSTDYRLIFLQLCSSFKGHRLTSLVLVS